MDVYARILIIAAAAPCVAFMIYVYRKDRVEKEPLGLLLLLLVGGFLSTGIAIVLEQVSTNILDYIFYSYSLLYIIIENFLCVGFVEEWSKYFFLKLFTWKNKNFNCTFDGIIYSVFVSLGFAMLENVLYVLRGGLKTALLRAALSIPGHVSYSVIMGLFYSYAKKAEVQGKEASSKRLRRAGLLLSSIVHGLFDFCLSVDNEIYIVIFAILVVVLDVSMFAIVKKESKNDEYLEDEVIEERNTDFVDWN